MRIVCPACNAAYQVPDEQLSEGKLVRCARCSTDWTPILPVPATESPSARPAPEPTVQDVPASSPQPALEEYSAPRRMALDEAPEIERVTAPAVVEPPRRGFPWLAVSWVASVAAVGAMCAALVIGRERVMQLWPPSVRGYAAIGLVKK